MLNIKPFVARSLFPDCLIISDGLFVSLNKNQIEKFDE